MTDEDPLEGIDPNDVEELRRLFNEILRQTSVEVEITDSAGLSDEVIAVLTRGSGSPAEVQVVRSGALPPVIFDLPVDAIALPAGADPAMFKRMLSLARKIHERVGPMTREVAVGYVGSALWDATHEQFLQAMSFVELVLHYLSN